MGKQKTHKGVKRRVKITGTGKIMHFRSGRRHLLNGKVSNRTRHLRGTKEANPANEQVVRHLLPYQ